MRILRNSLFQSRVGRIVLISDVQTIVWNSILKYTLLRQQRIAHLAMIYTMLNCYNYLPSYSWKALYGKSVKSVKWMLETCPLLFKNVCVLSRILEVHHEAIILSFIIEEGFFPVLFRGVTLEFLFLFFP